MLHGPRDKQPELPVDEGRRMWQVKDGQHHCWMGADDYRDDDGAEDDGWDDDWEEEDLDDSKDDY